MQCHIRMTHKVRGHHHFVNNYTIIWYYHLPTPAADVDHCFLSDIWWLKFCWVLTRSFAVKVGRHNYIMVEQQITILAAHFWCLALLLDAYSKHCPKIDHFLQKLQSSDTSCRYFWPISPKCNITRSKVAFGLQYTRGWGYILAQDQWSKLFLFSQYSCPKIDPFDNWLFTLMVTYVNCHVLVVPRV